MERKAQEFEKQGGTEAPYKEEKPDPKEVTNLTKMYKAMKGAAAGSSSLGQNMMAFGPLGLVFEVLSPLLEAFSPILEIVAGLLQAFIGPILGAMMPLLKPIFDLLISLMPVMTFLGELVGGFITWLIGEGGLITIFQALWDIMVDVGEFIWNVFILVWNGVWDAMILIGRGIEIIWNAIWLVVATVVNVIMTALEIILGGMNELFGWGWDEVLQFRMDYPTWISVIEDRPLDTTPIFRGGGRMLVAEYAKMKAGEVAVTGNQMEGVETILGEIRERLPDSDSGWRYV